jgi:hypothetical protein
MLVMYEIEGINSLIDARVKARPFLTGYTYKIITLSRRKVTLTTYSFQPK